MNKEEIKKVLAELKSQSKRNFNQSYDLIINLKNISIAQNPLDFFITLHYSKGKNIKIAAFVDNILADQAKKNFDLVITEPDFAKYSDKKVMKKLAHHFKYEEEKEKLKKNK